MVLGHILCSADLQQVKELHGTLQMVLLSTEWVQQLSIREEQMKE
jgi:hypothetical protein